MDDQSIPLICIWFENILRRRLDKIGHMTRYMTSGTVLYDQVPIILRAHIQKSKNRKGDKNGYQ
jgi:hypothetical protein